MNRHEIAPTPALAQFLETYEDDDKPPVVQFDGEEISFPNTILSGLIADAFDQQYVVVRNADYNTERIKRRQKLEQFFLVAKHDIITGEETVYDVSTNVERTRDPHRERDATYLGAVVIYLERNGKYAATLTMESERIGWVEPRRDYSFTQIT